MEIMKGIRSDTRVALMRVPQGHQLMRGETLAKLGVDVGECHRWGFFGEMSFWFFVA